MCFYCWPQQTNPHLKKPVNMHLYWSVGCYSFVTSVNDCCPSACSNTNSPILSWFNQHRAGQSHKPWTELMPNLWHRTGRTPAGKSLNNRAGQTQQEKRQGNRKGRQWQPSSKQAARHNAEEHKKWVRRMGNLWRKKWERLRDRKLYQGLSHAHTRNHEHGWKHHVVLSGAVNFGLNAVSWQGTLKKDLVGPHIQKTGRVISAPGTVLIKLEMQSHYPEVPKLWCWSPTGITVLS